MIWETGLGGRLDATNIVTPLASVITNVQLDHQKWLGQTVPEIAREKAGIIKPGVPALTGADDAGALAVIAEVARRQKAPLVVVKDQTSTWEIGLAGEHQKKNAALAIAIVRSLQAQIPVSETAIREGLKMIRWDGRLQIVPQAGGRIILLDGAHNPAGAQPLAAALANQLSGPKLQRSFSGRWRTRIPPAICRLLAPMAARILVAPVASDRGTDPQWLADCCRAANSAAKVSLCRNIADALAQAAGEPFVVVSGSLHFVGEAMEELGLASSQSERGLNEYGATAHAPAGIRAVTFDVGGTLIEPWPSVGAVYAEVAARHGLVVPADALDRQFALAWAARQDFGHSLSDWSRLVEQTFAGLVPGSPSAALFDALYRHFATAAPWRVFDDVAPCLRELRRRGLKLGIISNWDERLRPLLRDLKLDSYFDSIVVSGEAETHKPDPRIFQVAAAQLGVPVAAIVHIGDSAPEDVAGARAAGLQALHLTRGKPLAVLASLESLAALIR